MSMQGSTLRILEAANFTHPQALAVAEAIELEIKGAGLVTLPTLDGRFGTIDARFAQIDVRFSEMAAAMAKMETRLTNKMMALFGIGLMGIVVQILLALLKR